MYVTANRIGGWFAEVFMGRRSPEVPVDVPLSPPPQVPSGAPAG
jgi:hypothetical protein